jgi:hypothetical protein
MAAVFPLTLRQLIHNLFGRSVGAWEDERLYSQTIPQDGMAR